MLETYRIEPIGQVSAIRPYAEDGYWGGEQAAITLVVSELDAIDGTPVLDLKPVMQEFLPRCEVVQPAWSRELMSAHWLSKE